LSIDANNAEDDKAKAQFKLLIGELNRRLARFDAAAAEFAGVAKQIAPDTPEAKLVAFETKLVANRDAGIHFMSEVLGRNDGR
jgi:hypothetical protein